MSQIALKTETGLLKLPVVNNALLAVPIWEEKRGTNWLAVIDIDGTMPGGLSRRWMNRARGECYYFVEQLALFDPIEFGADRTAWSGNKVTNRWHGIIIEKTESYLIVEKTESGAQAILLAKERRAGIPKPVPPPPPRPPTQEELQAWAEALQKAHALLNPPKRGYGKRMVDLYGTHVINNNFPGAWEALRSAGNWKAQKKDFYAALEEAQLLIFAPRPPAEPPELTVVRAPEGP